MSSFSVQVEEIPLPGAATPRLRRVQVRWRGRAIADLTQGNYHCYLHPVYSPSGVPLTSESPVDHPHHNSVTVGADVLIARLPPLTPSISTLTEEATYNLYVNEVFQGRAPGRTWAVSFDSREVSDNHLRVVQQVQWQGPEEWGAASGRRVLAEETRTIDLWPGELANVIDIRSQLRPTEWDLSIGPTRHAYFTVRLADGLRVVDGGTLLDSESRTGGEAISGRAAHWVDMSGPASHGRRAGIAVIPHASMSGAAWKAYDWGTITVNPFLRVRKELRRGETLDLAIRILAHDGDAREAGVSALFEGFRRDIGWT